MIEIIQTYTGTSTRAGSIKIAYQQMYRCTECGLITPKGKEIKEHECRGEREHFSHIERPAFTGH